MNIHWNAATIVFNGNCIIIIYEGLEGLPITSFKMQKDINKNEKEQLIKLIKSIFGKNFPSTAWNLFIFDDCNGQCFLNDSNLSDLRLRLIT